MSPVRRGVVAVQVGLGLRECGGRLHVGDHLARAVPLVVAHAQDVDVVRARRSVDLEGFGLAGFTLIAWRSPGSWSRPRRLPASRWADPPVACSRRRSRWSRTVLGLV